MSSAVTPDGADDAKVLEKKIDAFSTPGEIEIEIEGRKTNAFRTSKPPSMVKYHR